MTLNYVIDLPNSERLGLYKGLFPRNSDFYLSVRRYNPASLSLNIGYSTMDKLETNNICNNATYSKYFTVDELNSEYKLRNILELNNVPNYKPKKIIRESTKYYPYRFKTKEEFEKEFGRGWKAYVNFNSSGLMDYLLGMDFPFPTENLPRSFKLNKNTGVPFEVNIDQFDNWSVNWKMLTENKPKAPDYSPKKIIREGVNDKEVPPNTYRFKTEEEFIREYGENWRKLVPFQFVKNMDDLLGRPFDKLILITPMGYVVPKIDVWKISMDMLVKIPPNYNPKKIVRE